MIWIWNKPKENGRYKVVPRNKRKFYHWDLKKQGNFRNSSVLQGVTILWLVAEWVSRAPSHNTLPAFLNLKGIKIRMKFWLKFKALVWFTKKSHAKMNFLKINQIIIYCLLLEQTKFEESFIFFSILFKILLVCFH